MWGCRCDGSPLGLAGSSSWRLRARGIEGVEGRAEVGVHGLVAVAERYSRSPPSEATRQQLRQTPSPLASARCLLLKFRRAGAEIEAANPGRVIYFTSAPAILTYVN